MVKKQVAIVTPFYQETVSAYEAIALQQCEKMLAAYPRIAIKPSRLTLPAAANPNAFSQIISFDDHFFANIAGYNHLMLSPQFYAQFSEYEYILIYQLDAFVFKDELAYWCNQDFDYIGAPWVRNSAGEGFLKSMVLKAQQVVSTQFNLKKRGLPNKYQFEGKVGNGGLSLRRVEKFHQLTLTMQPVIDAYRVQTAHQYNEDAFWGIEVNRKKKVLNIPSWQIALRFAFETYPQNSYTLNKQQLPFGCHDWDRYPAFWRPIFKAYGADI